MERFRSWLFAPGDSLDKCLKATQSAADQVIWDLEDAVSNGRKLQARQNVITLLEQLPASAHTPWIRINALDTSWGINDLVSVASAFSSRKPRWVIPKADQSSPIILQRIAEQKQLREGEWVLLIESAQGFWDLLHAQSSWRIPGSCRLAFGALDYIHDIGATGLTDSSVLVVPQTLLVWTSRVWHWPAPVDSVFSSIHDVMELGDSARKARAMGMAGKMVIHPAQIDPVNNAFLPSMQDYQWATSVIKAMESQGVTLVGGAMVDRPVLERARQILEEYRDFSNQPETT